MIENNSQQNNVDIGCGDFLNQMIDLADGTLSPEESRLLMIHMDDCPNCRKSYRLMMESLNITNKSQVARNAYIGQMTDYDKAEQINKITSLIKDEKKNRHTGLTKLFLPASRYRAFASTAAGIVILVFISYLFLSMSNINLNKIFNSSRTGYKDLTNQESNETDNMLPLSADTTVNPTGNSDTSIYEEIGSFPSDKSYTNDAEAAATSGDKTGTADISASCSASGSASGSASISSVAPDNKSAAIRQSQNTSVISANTGVKTNKPINIAGNSSDELWNAMQGFITYTEMKNDESNYLAIITYKKDIINNSKNQILQVTDKMNLTVKIEIISGENTQKLVEYTSIENAELLSKEAISKVSDFLIISIGR